MGVLQPSAGPGVGLWVVLVSGRRGRAVGGLVAFFFGSALVLGSGSVASAEEVPPDEVVSEVVVFDGSNDLVFLEEDGLVHHFELEESPPELPLEEDVVEEVLVPVPGEGEAVPVSVPAGPGATDVVASTSPGAERGAAVSSARSSGRSRSAR